MLKEIDFRLMFLVSIVAVIGVFLGTYLSRFVAAKNLKSGFGWFALAMAMFIVIREVVI